MRDIARAAACGLLLIALASAAHAQDAPAPAGAASADSVAGYDPVETSYADTAEAEPSPAPAAAPAPPRTVAPPPPDFESGASGDASEPATEPPPAPAPAPAVAPTGLTNVDAWTEYKLAAHLLALPQESRLFYRRALMLYASGGRDEALRLARGAIKLDPGYVAPRLTLATWLALRSPGEALEQLGGILRIVPDNFMIQIVAANNALYLVIQALFLAILGVAFMVVALDNGRLRHGWMERLASFVTADTARWWSWAILIAPYLAGVGPALPTLAFLGLLWPGARLRERSLFVLLALTLTGVPTMSAALDRLSSPLDAERGPFYGVPQLQTEPYSPELRGEFDRRLAAHPDSPFLRFAAGWLAQRGGDLGAAEAHYRSALELWPDDDRVLNNLGNAVAGQGRNDEAISIYHRAIAVNPRNPSAHFNLSQIYTMRFDFHTANEELARASALDFDMVKALQTERAETRWAGLTDQWIHPRVFWRSLQRVPSSTRSAAALPPLWRTRIECSGWTYSATALVVAVVSLLLGWWLHRGIPVRGCGNCGRAICRRCAERRREMALCGECSAIWSRAESSEFARVLLFQYRRRREERVGVVYRAVGLLLPGFGYLPHRRLLRAVLFLGVTAALLSVSIGVGTPFAYEPRFTIPGHDVPLFGLGMVWIAFYVIATPIYLAFEGRVREHARNAAAAVPRRRPVIAPNHPTSQAAA